MAITRPRWVSDREAYRERLAIMLDALAADEPDAPHWKTLMVYSSASSMSYETQWSKLASSALQGDWEPAKNQCRLERELHGEEHARGLMRGIQAAVRDQSIRLGLI